MAEQKDNGIWWMILSFVIPIVGIFMFFYKKKSDPHLAKMCLILGLAGIVIGFVLAIVLSPMS